MDYQVYSRFNSYRPADGANPGGYATDLEKLSNQNTFLPKI